MIREPAADITNLKKESQQSLPQIGPSKAQTVQPTGAAAQKENNVIKIIQKEWEKEIERLDAKKNGFKPKAGQPSESKLFHPNLI